MPKQDVKRVSLQLRCVQRRLLGYVQFSENDLMNRLQTAVENAVREQRLDHREAGRFLRFYESGLHGYTYLEEPSED